MKKILISAMLIVMGCFSMAAQNSIVNNPDNKAYFGIRVGGNLTCPGKLTSDDVDFSLFKNGGGVEVGGIFNGPIVANFYIEPGLKLYFDTYSAKKGLVKYLTNGILNSVSVRKFGMRVPIMAGYHFDFTQDIKLFVFTGPELDVCFIGKEYDKGQYVKINESLYGDNGSMNRVNLLWGFGAGISYQHLYFGVSGGVGMLNMANTSDLKFHENRVTFSLGYNF